MRLLYNNKGDPVTLSNDPWLREITRDQLGQFLDAWTESDGDWNPARVNNIVLPTTSTTLTILLRLPNVTCTGLGVELQLLEQARGILASRKAEVFDLTRKGVEGSKLRVVAWSEVRPVIGLCLPIHDCS